MTHAARHAYPTQPVRPLKASEAHLPPDQQRQVFDTRPLAVAIGKAMAAEQTHRWTAWDRIRWGAPFLIAGLAVGAVITAIVNHFIP